MQRQFNGAEQNSYLFLHAIVFNRKPVESFWIQRIFMKHYALGFSLPLSALLKTS